MTEKPSKFTMLRSLLTGPGTNFIMEAHNGLSAKIVEEAGFDGIWASGLSISAALGVRDNNELSWTQVLDVLEFMSDATSIPILVDGDTGYGNFNNFRRLVKKLCQRQIAGVCIEDKVFPKTNSFLGDGQQLTEIEEFCGKIKAGKDNQEHDDFSIVARIEALIAGRGMDEALRRAEAYADAGADAIVIHSKKADPDEILTFCRLWDHRVPVVLIPTKYYRTPTDTLREAGASLIIWANHNLRSSIQAMRATSARLKQHETLIDVESEVAPLNDVFSLADAGELEEAETRYLSGQARPNAVVLAATRGDDLGDLTADQPKCMLNVRGEAILGRQLRALSRIGASEPFVVAGYRAEAIDLPGINKVVNADYERTGEAASLYAARQALNGDCIISYGDVVYRPFFLNLLMERQEDFVILVDPNWMEKRETRNAESRDLVKLSAGDAGELHADAEPLLVDIGPGVADADGEWVGLLRTSANGARRLKAELERMREDGSLDRAELGTVLKRLMARGEEIVALTVSGNWMNINDLLDLAQARNAM
ncbi:phosphoenolpyruvate mutase [Stappia sp. F7233]|uniref:phosphoenolpyruvate mutase n=2 Tax=Stappia albiluteola TaxID=2758565 RepID=A0A839AJ06_9HYPH|nr:phosphoenolpyruvate mutase [Stappia albiluteola]